MAKNCQKSLFAAEVKERLVKNVMFRSGKDVLLIAFLKNILPKNQFLFQRLISNTSRKNNSDS